MNCVMCIALVSLVLMQYCYYSETTTGTLQRCINSLQLYEDDTRSSDPSPEALEDPSLHLQKVGSESQIAASFC